MRRTALAVILAPVLFMGVAIGQPADREQTFEVASVRPAELNSAARGTADLIAREGVFDPQQVRFSITGSPTGCARKASTSVRAPMPF